MKRIGLAALSILLASACQQETSSIDRKLDEINQRLTAIEGKLGNAPTGAPAAAARPAQPQRAQPDPSAVYAVPIGESAAIGAKLAKVTIVEAFTFT